MIFYSCVSGNGRDLKSRKQPSNKKKVKGSPENHFQESASGKGFGLDLSKGKFIVNYSRSPWLRDKFLFYLGLDSRRNMLSVFVFELC